MPGEDEAVLAMDAQQNAGSQSSSDRGSPSEDAKTRSDSTTESERAPLTRSTLDRCKFDVEEGESKSNDVKPTLSSTLRVFRYATCVDWFLMFLGSLAAIVHGFALPASLVLLSFVTDAFTFHEASAIIATTESHVPLAFLIRLVTPGFGRGGGTLGGLCDFPSAPELTGSKFRRSLSSRDVASTLLVNFTNVTGGVVNCSADYRYSISFPYNVEFTFNIDSVIKECIAPKAACYGDATFTVYITNLVIAFSFIAVLAVILGSLQVLFFQIASERQVKKIRLAYFRSVLRQDQAWHSLQDVGAVSSQLTEGITTIHHGIGANVVIMIQWVATFAAGLMAGFYLNWEMTLLLLFLMPFLVVPSGIFNRLAATFAVAEQKHYATAGSIAEEVLSAIRTVVAFGTESKETARYGRHLKAAKQIGTRRGLAGGVSLFFVNFTLFAAFGVAFWFGIYLILEGRALGGIIVAVFFSVLVGSFYLGQSTTNFANLMTAGAIAKPIFDTIDRKSEIDPECEEGEKPALLRPSVEFKDVTFSYPSRPNVPVMKGFNMSISPGQRVAVVGPSGSGKSTLVSLVQRFYDATSGQVLIGGYDVKDLNVQWLRSKIGTVCQDPVLFNKTIAENIRHGNEDATMEQVKEAARQANAHNFITHLPLGYNTMVGEQGTMLSGGQRQRITIARALVRNPSILLLDEATSALDSDNEFILQDAIKHASKERTVILITHRLSLVRCADVVVSVDSGEVIWQGTSTQLLSKKGIKLDKNHHADLFALHKKKRLSICDKSKTMSLKRMSMRRGFGPYEERQYGNFEIFKRLVFGEMTGKERATVALGLIGCFISGSAFPIFAILFGGVFESFIQPHDEIQAFVNPWAGGFLVLAVWAGTGALLKTLFFSVGGEILTKRVRRKAFSTMLRQEVGWFDQEENNTGGLITVLSEDGRNIQGAAGAHLGIFVEGTTSILLAHILSLYFNWSLTLVLLIAVPLYVFSGWLHVKASVGFVLLRRKTLQQATEIAVEAADNIEVVTALGLQNKLYREYEKKVAKPISCALALTPLYGISQGVLLIGYIIAFRYGAYQVTVPKDHIAHSDFVNIFKVFGAMIFTSIGIGFATSTFAPSYAAAKIAAQRIFTLFDRAPQPDGYSTEGIKLEKVRGELSLNQVYFRYPSRPEIKVIRDLSLAVNPGQTLALLGPSGSGKSTIFSLIERFYDPIAGSLSLDGKDFKELNIRWLRSLIGIVSQEPVLFDVSIADNIRYGCGGRREVTDSEVVQAAKAANIHSFIMSLPQGYSTNVGSKGTQLSGGQKQRVAVARALLQDPPILLLDEATAALDGKNEAVVQAALELVQRGRTSIVITHKLSTIRNADYIAVLSGGRLVEVGTHEELLARKGEYHRMVCLQQF